MPRTEHRLGLFVGCVSGLAACGSVAFAGGPCQVPSNETCSGRLVFATDDLPFNDQGLLGCVNDVIDKPYWDIFYRYDCTVSGEHIFEMCDSELDTYIRIYVSGCGWADGDEFVVDDDSCPGSPPNADPLLSVTLQAGFSYWVELGTWRDQLPWGAPNAAFRFSVTLAASACPWDLDSTGEVDTIDFFSLIVFWGQDPGGPPDFDGNGDVDVVDFFELLANWGPCG